MEYRDFTLELLTRSVDPTTGQSELQSLNTREFNIRHYRKQFSAIEIEYVRATKAVFPIMSIRWRFGHQSGIARAELPPGIDRLSEHVLNHLHLEQSLPDVHFHRLSEQLTRLLFPDDVLQAFSTAEAACQRSDYRLRLRIVADDQRLVRFPFEFVGHPWEGRVGTLKPLLLDPFYSLVRSVPGPLVSLEPVQDRPLRVLLVGASPRAENLRWIDTEAETVLIRGALRPLAQQKLVTVQVLLQATPEQLQRTLFESKERE